MNYKIKGELITANNYKDAKEIYKKNFIKTLYVWDISSNSKDTNIYAVEIDNINPITREVAENKARAVAYKLNGVRKCFMLSNSSLKPYEERHAIIPVPLNTPQLKKWMGKTAKPIAIYDGDEDVDIADILYQDFCEAVGGKMRGNVYFKIEGKNINWRGSEGTKYVLATTTAELLKSFYSEDFLELYNGKRANEFIINAPTHDTPMGSRYYFKPVSEKTYEKNL